MKKEKMTDIFIKQNGVHYTLTDLSIYMANILVNEYLKNNDSNNVIKVLDPACGDGELLIALSLVLKEKKIKFEMYGIDTNNEELLLAKKRLKDYKIDLICENLDYLENYEKFNDFDLIIANPPYVRIQNMESSKRKNNNNFAVSGRFDLYQLFFNAITYSLKYDGFLCIITSNKFMFNKSGNKTRMFLSSNYNINLILDLGDSKMFEASVLPAIFLGQKKLLINNDFVEAIKVYETKQECNSTYNIFQAIENKINCIVKKDKSNYEITIGTIDMNNSCEPWSINTLNNNSFIDKVNNKRFCFLSDWANVKVGIKTTADKVFIKNDISEFDDIEKELVYELICSKNSKKWKQKATPKKYIFYPYTLNNDIQNVIDLTKYPKSEKYIQKNSDILRARKYFKNSKKEWFEIWVTHNLFDFLKPKIVVPDISSESKFLYDDSGKLVDGNCYWITLKENIPSDYLFLILGLCNSKYMEKYHDIQFQNKLYSGKRRYVSQYINKYPMINPNSKEAKTIIEYVKMIIFDRCEVEEIELKIEENIKHYLEVESSE